MKKIGSTYYDDAYFADNNKHVIITDVDLVDDCDLVILWGGEDISPTIYGEQGGHYTHKTAPNKRDIFELAVMKRAVEQNIPILGVCRGMQLMVAANGGKLWQHVDGHEHGSHLVKFSDGTIIRTNSLHHQMVRPADWMEVLANTVMPLSRWKYDQDGRHEDNFAEPEFVYIPNVGLGVQAHPEYSDKNSQLTLKTVSLIKHYFDIKL